MGLNDSFGGLVVGDGEHTDIQRLFGIAQRLDKVAKALLGWEEDRADEDTVVGFVVVLVMVLFEVADQVMN